MNTYYDVKKWKMGIERPSKTFIQDRKIFKNIEGGGVAKGNNLY